MLAGPGAADVEPLDHLARVAPDPAGIEQPQRRDRAGKQEAVARLDGGERDVELHALVGEDAHAPPVLGDEGQAGVDRRPGIVEPQRASVLEDRAARREEPHQPVRGADLAVASEPAETEHLAFLQRERQAVHFLAGHLHVEIAHLERRRASRERTGGPVGGHDGGAPHHELGDAPDRGALRGEPGHHLAVAQHCDLVRDRQHLVEAVGDEEDPEPLGRERLHDPEQLGGLALREHRGRLIENQEPGVLLVHLAGDLDELHVADGEPGHRQPLVHAQADGVERRPRVGADALAVERLELPAGDPRQRVRAGRLAVELDVLRHGEARAYYRPATDTVNMPERRLFPKAEHYYSVLYHELTHSTGHPSRLARETLRDMVAFGDTNYSKEELCAEMGAAYLCGVAGIANETVDNSAAYIAGWLSTLRNDPRLVIAAAAQAQKAADFILGTDAKGGESGKA